MVTGLLLDTIPIEDVATVILRVWLLQLLLSSECSIRCGCWTVPYGHGGQNAMTTCCGSGVCGQGGTGGGGLVKITYF